MTWIALTVMTEVSLKLYISNDTMLTQTILLLELLFCERD